MHFSKFFVIINKRLQFCQWNLILIESNSSYHFGQFHDINEPFGFKTTSDSKKIAKYIVPFFFLSLLGLEVNKTPQSHQVLKTNI